jgi:flavin-dependent dehydrogenase
MKNFDVLVVGGGPVGLAAAIEARMLDLRAVVIEPRAGVIDKACGEGLMPGALPLLSRLGVRVSGHVLSGVRYSDSTRSVVHRFEDKPGLGVRRTDLHEALKARAVGLGVDFISEAVVSVASETNEVLVETSSGKKIVGEYLIGADGLHSSVAKLVDLNKPSIFRKKRRYGIRQHFKVAPWSDLIQVFYIKSAEVYITPVSKTHIGVAVLGPKKTDFEASIKSVPELVGKIDFSKAASDRLGAGPFPQKTKARRHKRVLLIGDASGYVDAITGEGLRLGLAHAKAALWCIKNNKPEQFDKLWRRASRDFRVLTGILAKVANSKLRGTIVPLAHKLPKVFGFIVERLAK